MRIPPPSETPEIIVGEALSVMRSLPAESFDAIITDPPYGQTSLEWDRWVAGWPAECLRLLKPTGSMWVFGSMRMFLDRRDEFAGWNFAQDVVWEKHNGSSFHADRFRRVHEQAVQFYPVTAKWADVWKGKVTTPDATKRTVRRKGRPPHMGEIEGTEYLSEDGGPRLMRSVIYCRSEHGSAVHPTQKPVEIVTPLILNACPPGGLILDPFAGSGTTVVAALAAGRRCMGIEVNDGYAAAALNRIAAAKGERLDPGPLFMGAAE